MTATSVPSANMSKYRITVDTGGTFTDVVYYAEDTREITI